MSNWASIDGEKEDEPRLLTKKEIKRILASLPQIKTGDDASTELAYEGVLETMRKQMQEIELCPSGIPEFKDFITEMWCECVSEPGTSIGTQAAEAIGSLLTQVMLNAFHDSGLAGGSGVGMVNSIIRASAVDNKSGTTIHFKNKYLTYGKALDYAAELECVTLRDLLRPKAGYEILSLRHMKEYPHRKIAKFTHLDTASQRDTAFSFLRLHLDPEALYRHRVSPLDIERVMGNRQVGRGFIVKAMHGSNAVDVLLDAGEMGKIDEKKQQTPDPDLPPRVWTETMAVTRYMNEFVTNMGEAIIKGIPGRKRGDGTHDIHPLVGLELHRKPILDMIEELGVEGEQRGFSIKSEIGTEFGLELERVVHAFLALGVPKDQIELFEDEYEEDTELLVPGSIWIPEEWSLARMAGAVKDARKVFLDRVKTPTDQPFELDEVLDATNLVYATAAGNNLSDIFALPFVDTRRTKSTSIHAMATYVGIESSRSTVISVLENEFGGRNSKIHPACLRFVGEHITSRGTPIGANYAGMSRFKLGHLSLAMVERANSVMSTAAIKGDYEGVNNTSAAVATGSVIAVGSGYSSIEDPIERDGRKLRNRALLDYDKYTSRKVGLDAFDLGEDDYYTSITETAAEDEMGMLAVPTSDVAGINMGNFLDEEYIAEPERSRPVETSIAGSMVSAALPTRKIKGFPMLDTFAL